MKLDCVVTSVNNNPLYIDFIPLFIKTWKKLYPDVDVKIILIHDNIPKKFQSYKQHIILFPPIKNVSTAFTSQYIRLLYPCIMKYKNGILISDMDMLPMNKYYYTENIKHISNDKFVYMRDVLLNHKEIAMCYNVATPNTWSDIFDIKTLHDIKVRIKDVYNKNTYVDIHGGKGWNLDQLHLYEKIMQWNSVTNNFVTLNDQFTRFNRLDRIHCFNLIERKVTMIIHNSSASTSEKIKNGFYSDYHCYRPYESYKEINEKIYNLL